jgi:ABC-type glucose/galactose transport system permease subunit
LKTGLVVIIGGPIFTAHVTFGIVEALHDFFYNRGTSAFFAGMAGVLSHTLFGFITVLSLRYLGSILAAIIITVIVHMFWNWFVIGVRRKVKD